MNWIVPRTLLHSQTDFLFKVLLLLFTALVFLQAIAFFYRSYLEWKEGPESEHKYLDRDVLERGDTAVASANH